MVRKSMMLLIRRVLTKYSRWKETEEICLNTFAIEQGLDQLYSSISFLAAFCNLQNCSDDLVNSGEYNPENSVFAGADSRKYFCFSP